MPYTVVFTPEAEEQLAAIYRYIAAKASPETAERYTSALVSYCEGMQFTPHRGTRRDDIRSGLRITNYKKRSVIAFAVDAEQVSIIGVFYGGQDYETALESDLDD
jgi:plasmid stabilization system protein ParE